MENRKEGLSKRQARREEIRRKERQQRLTVMAVIGGIVVLVLAAIILPNIFQPDPEELFGEVKPVTPVTYENMDGAKLGDPNAPVTIEIFEDFQCTACENFSRNYEQDVINNLVLTGQAYYKFYNYPFLDDASTSKDSDRAANAAYCAAEQNRFWDYKNIVFANWGEAAGVYTDARLKQFAEAIDLDMDAFDACYSESRYQAEIDKEIALGQEMGVTGTPSVFVNGADVAPGRVPTFEQIQAAVQAAAGE
jgi:protein-disulfide isomerase